MNLLYCGDRKIIPGLELSVLSVSIHSNEDLHVYVLTIDPCAELSDEVAVLDRYLKSKHPGSEAILHDCCEVFRSCLPAANMQTRFTPGCMLRLYSDLVPGLPDKILYLDYDVVCLRDPSEYYNQDTDNLDYYGSWFYTPLRHNYCNSGVLLMNLGRMKADGLLEKCRLMCRDRKMFLPDQHALNRCGAERKIAPRRFNDQRRLHADTVFRHFSTTWRVFPFPHTVTIKPWEKDKIDNMLHEHAYDDIYAEAGKLRPEIPVFFTVDDNYVPWLAVAIKSITLNSSTGYRYRIIVLHQGLKQENMNRIKALEQPGFTIEFSPVKERFDEISDSFMGNKLRADYFTLTIFFRLFIPDMFPQYSKGIYLDSDLVVNGDLSKLYNIELGSDLIAACPDYSIQEIPDFVDYVTKTVGCPNSIKYINSGILLMDLEGLRKANLGRRFLEVLGKYHFDCIAPDQDYINALCMGRIHYLGEEWDAMPNNTKKALENPMIIHYNLFAKPWCYDNIQYEEYFWKYAQDSGFLTEIKKFKEGYSQEQKDSDVACAKGLVGRGAMLAEKSADGNCMAHVFGSGKEARL